MILKKKKGSQKKDVGLSHTEVQIKFFLDYNGEFVGPHRVWLKKENIPGLAMSRSMGDQLAASVGVIQEPGIISFNMNSRNF